MGQHFLRQPAVQRLPVLLEELQTGELRIPPFQRDFVWEGWQRLHLLDSVLKGLPAGSVMVWRTTRALKTDPQLGPLRRQLPDPPKNWTRQYLLDGRQRLTTLFAALAPGLWTREDDELPAEWSRTAPDETEWAISFDLDSGEFVLGERDGLLPLRVLLDDFTFDRWLGEFGGQQRQRWNSARALKSAVLDYLIPVMPLHTDDLSAVTLTFKRVNRAGTPMGDLAMARALSWTEGGFDLELAIRRVLSHLSPSPWRSLEPETAFKVLAAVVGLEPFGIDVEALAREVQADKNVVARLRRTLVATFRILGDMGVTGPASLPYERALVLAAWVITEAPDARRMELLSGWLADACISEAFSNSPPHVMRAMKRELVSVVQGESPGRRPRKARRARKFSMAWARSRVAAVVMARQRPLRVDGSPMFSDAARALGQGGNDVLGRLLDSGSRGLPLGSAANRLLCDPDELPALRDALLHREASDDVCRSHLFPESWDSPLDLLSRRDLLIHQAEASWLESLPGHESTALSWVDEPSLDHLEGNGEGRGPAQTDLFDAAPAEPTSRERAIRLQEALDGAEFDVRFFEGYGPVVACPSCGASLDQLEGWSAIDEARDDLYAGVRCKACGWDGGGEV